MEIIDDFFWPILRHLRLLCNEYGLSAAMKIRLIALEGK